jgi:hypothetical protein
MSNERRSMSTSNIIAHEEIEGLVYSQVDFAKDFGQYGEQVHLEIQHDPCCPGEICLGVLHDSQRMGVVSLYLDRDRAITTAIALLAAAAHADRPRFFTDESIINEEEQWRNAHELATTWVRENPHAALIHR